MVHNVTLESRMGCEHLNIGTLNLLFLIYTIFKRRHILIILTGAALETNVWILPPFFYLVAA